MAVAEATEARLAESTLDELARTIAYEHGEVTRAANDMVAHALRAGDALLVARRQLQHGAWGAWLTDNCSLDHSTATWYMRLASYREVVEHNAASIADAKRLLTGKPSRIKITSDPKLREQVEQLRVDGLTWDRISVLTGVPKTTLRRLDPDIDRKAREKSRARYQPKDADELSAKTLLVRAGGRLPAVRQVVIKCLTALQQELEAEQYPPVRAEIERVMQRLYDVEDQLVAAAKTRLECGP
jgi:hypothetical protein